MTDNALMVADPGDANQLEVIAGDARLMLELAYEELHTRKAPDLAQVESAIVAAHERVQQLEQFGEMAVAALAGIQEQMTVIEQQRDEAVRKHADLEEDVEAEVDERVQMELDNRDYYDGGYGGYDANEIHWEVEQDFVSGVQQTAASLKQLGEIEAADDLLKNLREAKRLRDEVERLTEQYDKFIWEKRRAALGDDEDEDLDGEDDDAA